MDIEQIRRHIANGLLVVSQHAKDKYSERGINTLNIIECIMDGEIIEDYPKDKPFPSCLIYGTTAQGDPIHTVIADNGEYSIIVTAYYPTFDKWEHDYKTRKRGKNNDM